MVAAVMHRHPVLHTRRSRPPATERRGGQPTQRWPWRSMGIHGGSMGVGYEPHGPFWPWRITERCLRWACRTAFHRQPFRQASRRSRPVGGEHPGSITKHLTGMLERRKRTVLPREDPEVPVADAGLLDRPGRVVAGAALGLRPHGQPRPLVLPWQRRPWWQHADRRSAMPGRRDRHATTWPAGTVG